MPPSPTGPAEAFKFSGCPFVSACVSGCVRPSASPGVHAVSTIPYKPMNRISPNFGSWCT